MELQATVDDLRLLLRTPQLDHGGALDVEFATHVLVDGIVDEGAHHLDGGGDVGELEPRILQCEKRFAKGMTLTHILERQLVGCLDDAERSNADDQSLLRELLHQLDEAGALRAAEQMLCGYAQAVEEEFRGVLALLADLLELASTLETRWVVADFGDEQ